MIIVGILLKIEVKAFSYTLGYSLIRSNVFRTLCRVLRHWKQSTYSYELIKSSLTVSNNFLAIDTLSPTIGLADIFSRSQSALNLIIIGVSYL